MIRRSIRNWNAIAVSLPPASCELRLVSGIPCSSGWKSAEQYSARTSSPCPWVFHRLPEQARFRHHSPETSLSYFELIVVWMVGNRSVLNVRWLAGLWAYLNTRYWRYLRHPTPIHEIFGRYSINILTLQPSRGGAAVGGALEWINGIQCWYMLLGNNKIHIY